MIGRIRPTPEQLAPLSRVERFAFRFSDWFNDHRLLKRSSGKIQRFVGWQLVRLISERQSRFVGLEQLQSLTPDRGILIVSNHRTFIDQFLVCGCLYAHTNLIKENYFPVRAEFFYETLGGVAVNLLTTAMAMYPPVFRVAGKRDFNAYGVKRMVELLQTPGNLLGIHPEGTRNKGDDPYQLLPAQPGIGKLVIGARPLVIPAFMNGMHPDLWQQARRGRRQTAAPIITVFGAPLDLQAFYQRPNTLRTQKHLGDHVMHEIARLAELEKRLRRMLAADPQPDRRFYAIGDLTTSPSTGQIPLRQPVGG